MMIYDTLPLEEISKGRLGLAARRELDTLLSDIYASASREWLARQVPEGRGLHLANGSGEDSLIHAELQPSGRASTFGQYDGVPCVQAYPLDRDIDQDFDFAYTRIWTGAWSGMNALLPSIRRHLKPGGVLLAEVVPLSGYQSYPYNHAFARAMELIGLLETPRSTGATPQEQIRVLLQQAGFEISEWSVGLPAFLPRTGNRIVSLALEACKEAILYCRDSTAEELNALLLELREFEMQGDTLISRPGLLQIAAFSNDLIPAQSI